MRSSRQLQQEIDATNGWERQLHKRAADALKRNLNLRKVYMDACVGLGRWAGQSTTSGSNDKRNRDGNAYESGQTAKNAKRKDYYKILGVPRDANEAMIKKAYRKAAMKWHPDRWASKSEREQKVAETNFKHVGESYGVLSDDKKRQRYDSGVDIQDLDNEHAGHGGMGGMDPSDLFAMFMGGGMGGGMRGRGGGVPRRGGRGGFPGGMGGFPGGVHFG